MISEGRVNPLPLDLNDLYLFAQVVDKHGFTAAGDALGIPKSRISRRITLLEERLGVRLLHRTSRRLNLTDAGQALYSHCVAMLHAAQAGEDAVRDRQREPSGLVRISVPQAIADVMLAKLMPLFLKRYPQVRLAIQVTNQPVDLLEDNFDVVVRGVSDRQASSSLIQTSLGNVRWGLLAVPQWLQEHGPLTTLVQLEHQHLLLHSPTQKTQDTLMLCDEKQQHHAVPVEVRMYSDNVAMLKEAALAGLGICTLPLYACVDELKEGRLTWLLPEFRPKSGQLVLLFPSRRGIAPAVRALLDFMKAELTPLLEHCSLLDTEQ